MANRKLMPKWEITTTKYRVMGWLVDYGVVWIPGVIVANVEGVRVAVAIGWITLIWAFVSDVILVRIFGVSIGKWVVGTRISINKKKVTKPKTMDLVTRWSVKWGLPFFVIALLIPGIVAGVASVIFDVMPIVILASIARNEQRCGFHDRLAKTYVLRRIYA